MQALPNAERQALGIHIGEGLKLKQVIRANPLARGDLRVALSPDAIHASSTDSLRLLGMDGYAQIPNDALRTFEQHVREVYPGVTPEQLQALVSHLLQHPAGGYAELARLHLEFTQLRSDLAHWVNATPHRAPDGRRRTLQGYEAARQTRAQFAQRLEQCWRRENSDPFNPKLSFLESVPGDLPVLSADFSHVSALELNGSNGTVGIEGFLQRFTQIRRLDLRHFALPGLPDIIPTLPRLHQLRLRHCGLTLTASRQASLSTMSRLTTLDLQGNLLGLIPNLESMSALTHLNLESTGLTALPNGILGHPRLRTMDLGNNQLTSLPQILFELPPPATDGMNFAHNPFVAAIRERIKAHYQQTGRHFGVWPEQADITRIRTLFPDLNQAQASELIYNLPGSLIQGRIQTTQWESEIVQLGAELSRWTEQLPQPNPLNGAPFTAAESMAELTAREAFANQLQNLWRARSTNPPYSRANSLVTNVRFMGDLPLFTPSFDHISNLTLIGSRSVRATPLFFQKFPRLRDLQLNNFALDQLPQTLAQLPQLTTLTLNQCGVVFTPHIQTSLASMSNLKSLALPNNPLGSPPDVSLLPQLDYLDLSNTGIAQMPTGLMQHARLKTALLSDNQFTGLPDELFELPAHQTQGLDFSNNPLSARTREQIKAYSSSTGQNLGVAPDLADVEATRVFFPSLDNESASDIFYALPGNLEQGRRQLRHWKAEVQLLTDTLDTWKTAVPKYHPVSGEALSHSQTLTEHRARSQFADQLLALWRARTSDSPRLRESALSISADFIGDLPTIGVDFQHISSLVLHGNPALGALPTFLDTFAGLHHLGIQNTALGSVPQAITRMSQLKSLILNRCTISITPQQQSILAPLTQLELLDLGNNPLGLPPDIEGLPELKRLSLANTGISTLPNGLTTRQHLTIALFSDNRISELPDGLFDTPSLNLSGFDFANNPLSLPSREKIKRLFTRTQQTLGVPIALEAIDRAMALFPSLTAQDANKMLYWVPGTLEDGLTQLTRWEAEIRQLNADLDRWATDIPQQHPATGQPLNLTFTGDMPAINADMGFVGALVINGTPDLHINEAFLGCFTGLKILEPRNLALNRVPQAINAMPSIEHLALSRCGVTLHDGDQAVLSALRNLQSLDLGGNPLARTPDLQQLKKLTFLDLAHTGLSEAPAHLAQLPELEIALLNDNRISEIGGDIFDLPVSATNGFDFGNNPINPATRERVKAYYQRSGEDLGVLAEAADIARVQTLHPNLDTPHASAYCYSLPGTLTEGRNHLTRLEAELSDLTRDLTRWVAQNPDDPVTGAPLNGAQRIQQEEARDAFKESLLIAWRKRPTEGADLEDFEMSWTHPLIGELPTLTADFSHVLFLTLINDGGGAPRIGRFLEAFPGLDSLTVHNYPLAALPDAVFKMSRLKELNLTQCNIRLSINTMNSLAELTQLNVLNLRDNPLGLTPNLSALRNLESLNLSNTGITAIPKGVLDNYQWHSVYLADNAIQEMPDSLLEVPDEVGAHYNLRNNPFTVQSMDTIRTYYHATGNTLNVQGIAAAPGMPPVPMEE